MKIKNLQYLSILAVLASCSFHPPAPPSKEEREREFVRCFREEMQPTDEQVKQLQGEILRPDAATRQAAEDLRKETNDLERLLETPAAKDPELLDHFRRVGALRDRLSEDHFRKMLVLRGILRDDQKKRFLDCKRKMGPPQLPQE